MSPQSAARPTTSRTGPRAATSDTDNLALLCWAHHRQADLALWTIEPAEAGVTEPDSASPRRNTVAREQRLPLGDPIQPSKAVARLVSERILRHAGALEREDAMPRRIRIGRVDDFTPGAMTEVEIEGHSLIVVRDDEGVCAARNRCPHLGLSLTKGPGGRSYADGVVQCPWHNSRFVVRTGENLDWVGGVGGRSVPRWSRRVIAAGRKPAPLTTYPVVVEGDEVFVEI